MPKVVTYVPYRTSSQHFDLQITAPLH